MGCKYHKCEIRLLCSARSRAKIYKVRRVRYRKYQNIGWLRGLLPPSLKIIEWNQWAYDLTCIKKLAFISLNVIAKYQISNILFTRTNSPYTTYSQDKYKLKKKKTKAIFLSQEIKKKKEIKYWNIWWLFGL